MDLGVRPTIERVVIAELKMPEDEVERSKLEEVDKVTGVPAGLLLDRKKKEAEELKILNPEIPGEVERVAVPRTVEKSVNGAGATLKKYVEFGEREIEEAKKETVSEEVMSPESKVETEDVCRR